MTNLESTAVILQAILLAVALVAFIERCHYRATQDLPDIKQVTAEEVRVHMFWGFYLIVSCLFAITAIWVN